VGAFSARNPYPESLIAARALEPLVINRESLTQQQGEQPLIPIPRVIAREFA